MQEGIRMIDQNLFQKIDLWFEAHREAILADIERMVRIASVSKPSKPEDIEADGPFGPGCKRAMDEMLAIAREHGFCTKNCEYYVGTIGEGEFHPENTIGFWNHLDVVPTGEGWSQDPFEPVLKDGFLIGRGAQDNKGPAIGILYLMQCIRELSIPMKHELRSFVGCDEERGMCDLEYYKKHYPTPMLSMIADSGFPVCYGEKGIVEGQFLSKEKFGSPVKMVAGGSASNMIPDRTKAVFAYSDELYRELKSMEVPEKLEVEADKESICVTAFGTSRHSAFPEGSVNAIYQLANALCNIKKLGSVNQKLFLELAGVTKEYYGETEKIAFSDEVSGKTTCAGTVLSMEDGHLCINLNIRYAITQDSSALIEQLETYALAHGFEWRLERLSKPNYFPKEHPAVSYLTDLYNEWMGTHTEAFVMGGGTYARKLPKAFAYGIGGMPKTADDIAREKRLFKPGTGGAHEPDEGLNLRMYFAAMKFYTLAVIGLDQLDL